MADLQTTIFRKMEEQMSCRYLKGGVIVLLWTSITDGRLITIAARCPTPDLLL